MEVEMQVMRINGNDGTADQTETVNNGDGAPYMNPEATERDGLLHAQISYYIYSEGRKVTSAVSFVSLPVVTGGDARFDAGESQINLGNMLTSQENNSMCKIMDELKKPVCYRIRLWMVIFIFLVIFVIAVVLISMIVCSALHKDKDENFDRSLFKVPHSFNGSFQLPNLVFSEELFTLSSNQSQTLAIDLQEKLAALYQSSPALGRYFSKAEITAFRNGSVTADYQLTFIMPEEQQDQLRNFTLSREMVYNVFRQFLYDQETAETDLMYIDPDSLNMLLRH